VTQKQAKKQKFQAHPKENVEEISNIKDRLIYISRLPSLRFQTYISKHKVISFDYARKKMLKRFQT